MPIKPSEEFITIVEEQLHTFNDRIEDLLLNGLIRIGERAVNIARQHHRYKDQTGNLTSSVGYAIVKDGKVVMESSFEQTRPTATEGSNKGRSFAHSLAKAYPEGIALVVVAGMNYAAYVERRGLGGMTEAELRARNDAEKLLVKITKQAYRKEQEISRLYETMKNIFYD